MRGHRWFFCLDRLAAEKRIAASARGDCYRRRVCVAAPAGYSVHLVKLAHCPVSRSSVGEPPPGRRDTVILVTSPIRSQAWIAQGKWNRDERVAPFIEHELDSANVAVKELIRGWSISLVCQLEAAGRTGPGHDVPALRSRPAYVSRTSQPCSHIGQKKDFRK